LIATFLPRSQDELGALAARDGIGMTPLEFFTWLSETAWSVDLHESEFAYPIIESVHVWTLCVFFGLMIMVDLRLLGWSMRAVPVSEVLDRVLPWAIAGFVVMVISGTLLVLAIPLRSYQNLFFRGKMIMLVVAGLNAWLFHYRVYPKIAGKVADGIPPKALRVAGATSLALWIAIVFCGRMIAYNWFDCDRQPQPAIINFLTSCVPAPSVY
jgi:Family of unknown function (DUF6644)